jgi:hypothetical protein
MGYLFSTPSTNRFMPLISLPLTSTATIKSMLRMPIWLWH